ncbi:MAG: DUF5049 domain-containing protein [Armatimonadota bacterium]
MIRINPIQLPAKVFDGIEAVRLSGKTNMFDLPEVVRLAIEMDFIDAAMWVENERSLYSLGLFLGFEKIDEGGAR